MEFYKDFPDTARVWIYQCDRPVPEEHTAYAMQRIEEFTRQWTSHNRQLRAAGALLHGRFLVLMADESAAGASGCSIDASMHFIKGLGQELGVDFTDRMQFAWKNDGHISTLHRDALPDAYRKGVINDETLVFDNLVKTKGDFERRWTLPLRESWIYRFVQ